MELELVDITGYEGLYQINRTGQVWSVKRQIFMKPSYTNGYYFMTLRKENKPKTYSIHRLLALQFLPNPLGLSDVDHIDINKSNNSLDNLRWVSHRTNSLNINNKSISGEQHILVTPWNKYKVQIRLGKNIHTKYFNTIDEAKIYRDTFIRDNNLF